jgi:hypothetical protein
VPNDVRDLLYIGNSCFSPDHGVAKRHAPVARKSAQIQCDSRTLRFAYSMKKHAEKYSLVKETGLNVCPESKPRSMTPPRLLLFEIIFLNEISQGESRSESGGTLTKAPALYRFSMRCGESSKNRF